MQTTATRILIVDDEAAIREMVGNTMRPQGYEVNEAANTVEADRMIADHRPDLVLLDWMMPGVSGIDYARRLGKDSLTADLPIIMLTARDEENDRLRGFDAGCDDYVSKPFSIKELNARIKAVLKRGRGFNSDGVISHQSLHLDPAGHRVVIDNTQIKVGPTEFRLLKFFMANPERVHSRVQLLDRVWGANVYVEERTVDVHIRRLRKLLKPHGCDQFVQTVHGTGYRFSSKSG